MLNLKKVFFGHILLSMTLFATSTPSESLPQEIKQSIKKENSEDSTERTIYDKARRFVVMISTKAYLTADSWGGSSSTWKGSGFIINKEKGLIVTNKHVIGELSVATYEIKFHDGTVLNGNYLYADPIYDFAILKVDPSKIPLTAIVGDLDQESLKINESVYSIGNSAGDEFSVHKGIVFSIFENLGPFSEQSFQFSGVTVGGASGSPVIGENNKIKGILYGGKFVSGAGLPIAYISRVLKSIEESKEVKRYTTGCIFGYQTASDSVDAGLINSEDYDIYKKEFPDAGDKIIVVSTRIVNSPAFDCFKPGDIILKVDDKLVGPNLLIIDEIIDVFGKDNKEILFTVLRNGKKIDLKVKTTELVMDSNFDFINFGGALWSDVSEKIKLKTGISEGVLIIQADQTSAFGELSSGFSWGMLNIVIKSIDGKELKKLSDLEKLLPELILKKNFLIEYVNLKGYQTKMTYEEIRDNLPRQALIKYDAKFDSAKIYNRNSSTKEWDKRIVTACDPKKK